MFALLVKMRFSSVDLLGLLNFINFADIFDAY